MRMHLFQPLPILALAAAAVVALPVLAVLREVFRPDTEGVWAHLLETVLAEYVVNSLLLALGAGLGAALLGVGCAWIVAMHRFRGRGVLEWALLLPLASAPKPVAVLMLPLPLALATTPLATLPLRSPLALAPLPVAVLAPSSPLAFAPAPVAVCRLPRAPLALALEPVAVLRPWSPLALAACPVAVLPPFLPKAIAEAPVAVLRPPSP